MTGKLKERKKMLDHCRMEGLRGSQEVHNVTVREPTPERMAAS
jgi:hypothetical protein